MVEKMRKQLKNESIILYAEYAANYAAHLESEIMRMTEDIIDYVCSPRDECKEREKGIRYIMEIRKD